MPIASACPDVRDLQRLLLGQVPRPEAERLEQHLAQCGRCGTVVTNLKAEDTLVEAMRAAAGSAVEEPGQEIVDGLIRRLKELRAPRPESAEEATMRSSPDPTPDPAGPPPEATGESFDFLTPPQGPNELGRLGPYRVLKVLGAGGMGVVFQAEDPRLKRLVALKVMRPQLAARTTARDRFLREAQTTAAVEHDHIVPIYEVGEERGVPFLAMPLLKGEPLDDRLKREAKLPLADVLRIGREAAEGLAAAHEHGLIHRDMKPGNLWLEGQRQRVKILDFGLARASGDDMHLTQSGVIVGTPAYMAPEQARGEAVDARCDLFSLGVVLYRMATGALPFRGTDTMSLLLALAMDTPKPPRELNPEVPPALNTLILRLLAKDPADRPVSAGVVVKVLDTLEKQIQAEARKATLVPGPAVECVRTGRDARDRSRVAPGPHASSVATPVPAVPVARVASRPQAVPAVPETPARARAATLGTVAATPRPAPMRARSSFRGRLPLAVAAALLFVVGLGAVIVIRLTGGEGTVTIETVDPDVEVSVKKNGQEVVILDKKTNQEVTLKAGAYEVEFKTGGEGLKLVTRNFTLKRGDKVAVKVTWDPEAKALRTGEPVSPLALVTQPARIEGVQSWTIETREHRGAVQRVSCSPDGHRLATGGDDGTIRFWDTDSGRLATEGCAKTVKFSDW